MLSSYLTLPRTVHLLCLGTFINRAATFVVLFLTPYLTAELGFSVQLATLTMGMVGLGSVIGNLLGGQLADTIGRKPVMVAATFGVAAGLFGFGAMRTPWTILPAVFVLFSIGEMYRPAAHAMIADVVRPDARPRAYGLMYVAINLGFSVAPMLGGVLAERSFWLLFIADGLTSAAFGCLVLLFIPESKLRTRPVSPVVDASAADGPSSGARNEVREPHVPAWIAVRLMARDRCLVAFCAATLMLAMVIMQGAATLPLYLRQQGFSLAEFGRIIAVNGIMVVLFQLPATALFSRFDRGRVITVAAVMYAIGFGLTGAARSGPEFVGTVVLWTIGELMQAPLVPSIVTQLAPRRLRARYFGAISMCYAGANMIGAPLGGWVFAQHGGRCVWLATAGLALVASLLYAYVGRQLSLIRRATHA